MVPVYSYHTYLSVVISCWRKVKLAENRSAAYSHYISVFFPLIRLPHLPCPSNGRHNTSAHSHRIT